MLGTNIHARHFQPENKAMELPGNSPFELFLLSFCPYVVFVRVSGGWVRYIAMDDAMDAFGMEQKEGSCSRLIFELQKYTHIPLSSDMDLPQISTVHQQSQKAPEKRRVWKRRS
jgi:hypothetical protein